MTASTARRGRYALAAIAAVAALAITLVFTLPGRSPGRAFPPLVPAAAPALWPHLTLPNGTAVLSYPPSLHPLAGDTDAVSAGQHESARPLAQDPRDQLGQQVDALADGEAPGEDDRAVRGRPGPGW